MVKSQCSYKNRPWVNQELILKHFFLEIDILIMHIQLVLMTRNVEIEEVTIDSFKE
ncbi:hypothetical protein ACO3TA_07350 [Methanocaldococcus sp. 28A]